MATRWNSKHTGQKIDDTIDYVTNPNLLDNWYFGNPVNQRGQTNYTAAGYCIDRWKLEANGSNKSVSVGSGGIELTFGGDTTYLNLVQIVERLPAGTYIVSFLVDDFSNVNQVFCYTTNKSTFSFDKNVVSLKFTLTADTESVKIGVQKKLDADALTIIAAKLELGTQQTLAHQDANGNWVLNEIPDYGEQLRRCQRYFWRCKFARNDLFFGSLSANLDRAWITIPTPVVMRTAPSVSFSKTFNVIIRGNGFQVEAFTSNSAIGADTSTTRCCNILITPNTKPSNWTAQQVVMIYTSSEWYLDCSADL